MASEEVRIQNTLELESLLARSRALVEVELNNLLPSAATAPEKIHNAIRWSVFAGGKRFRPALLLATGQAFSASTDELIRTACAFEMVHTYSLIHDDLPALDNDDLRRGQPTCHVAFGEATAILAGDALQTLAFQTIASLPSSPFITVQILREVTMAVGTGIGKMGDLQTALPPGMIGGQVVDIESEGKPPTADLVESIHRAKTGALITVSIVAGGLYGTPAGEVSSDVISRLRTFGEKAGLAFQIIDDVLDMTQDSAQLGKTAGKDTASIKATWPAVYGIEQSYKDAEELIADAFAALAPFGPAANPLKSLATYLVERKH